MGLGPSVPKNLVYPDPKNPETVPEAYWPYKRPHPYYYFNPKTHLGRSRVVFFFGIFLIPGTVIFGIKRFGKSKAKSDALLKIEKEKAIQAQREMLLAKQA